MAEQKLTLKQSLAAIWQQAETTFATKTDVGKVSTFAYGVSSTAVGTAAKVITLQGVSDWTLKSGAIIAVSFTTGTNTANNPTFNVNGTGAKRVKYNGALIASTDKDMAGTKLVQFYYYDGSNWVWFFRDYGEAEDEVVSGYFNSADNKFYTNSSFTGDPIIPSTTKIYVDASTGKIYVANDQATVKLAGRDIDVNYDTTNNKLTKTVEGTTTDIVTAATIVSAGGGVTDVAYNNSNHRLEQTKNGTVGTVMDRDAAHDLVGRGANGGVASLDTSGKVPESQLPSYVDDVLEYNNKAAFPATGESGKIYVAKDTNLTYRWSGSAYVEISPSLALGETSSTAYAGDKGKALADKLAGIPGDANKADVNYDTTNKKITKTIDGTTSDVVTVAKLKTDMALAKGDVGLGNVTNDAQVKRTEMGAASGVATLDATGKVPSSQLPNSIKDIIVGYYQYNTSTSKGEFYSDSGKTTAVAGETDKEYKDAITNLVYVYDGVEFVLLNGDYFAVTQTELNEILGIS